MESLGINIVNIIIYIILFAAVYYVLNKYLVKIVIDTLEKRRKEAENNIALGEKLQKQTEELELSKKQQMDELKAEAKEALKKNLKQAQEEKSTVLAEAKNEADGIIKKANQRLAQEREKMSAEMAQKVQEAAVKVAKDMYKIDKTNIDKKLIDQALTQI